MAGVLRISEAASMALHALVLLSSSPGEFYSTGEMADYLDASSDHLSKVLQRLTKVGFVSPIRGRQGGYALAKRAESATVLEVVEALDGPFSRKKCNAAVPGCEGNPCVLEKLLDSVHEQVIAALGRTKLRDTLPLPSHARRKTSTKAGAAAPRVVGTGCAGDALPAVTHPGVGPQQGPSPVVELCCV